MEAAQDTLHDQEEAAEGTTGEATEHANRQNQTADQRAQETATKDAALAIALGITTDELSSLNTALQNAGIRNEGHGGHGGFHN